MVFRYLLPTRPLCPANRSTEVATSTIMDRVRGFFWRIGGWRLHRTLITPLNLSYGDLLFLILTVAVELAFLINPLTRLSTSVTSAARTIGTAVQLHMAALLIPLTKNNNILHYLFNISFERGLAWHRWLSRWTVFLTTLHLIGELSIFAVSRFGDLSAMISFGAMGTMMLLSFSPIRRHAYELFSRPHLFLFPVVYLFAFIHQASTILFTIGPLLLYLADWVMRRRRGRHATVESVEALTLPGAKAGDKSKDGRTIYEIRLRLSKSMPAPREFGQFVYLYIPSISRFQMHPFSILAAEADSPPRSPRTVSRSGWDLGSQETLSVRSAGPDVPPSDEDDSLGDRPQVRWLTFWIRGTGNFTRLLGTLKLSDSVWVDGPFGSCSIPLMDYDSCLLVAGGIGITPIFNTWSFLLSQGLEAGMKCRTVRLAWVIRADEEDVLLPRLLELVAKGSAPMELSSSCSLRTNNVRLQALLLACIDVFVSPPSSLAGLGRQISNVDALEAGNKAGSVVEPAQSIGIRVHRRRFDVQQFLNTCCESQPLEAIREEDAPRPATPTPPDVATRDRRIGVSYCGPKGLRQLLVNSCCEMNSRGYHVDFNHETFEF